MPEPDTWAGTVLARDAGQCQWHGGPATDAHHRRFRSQGGRHEPGNRAALCGPGNAAGCHGRAHGPGRALAEKLGYVVPSWRDPAEVPMWSEPRRSWVLLHDDGTITMLDREPPDER